MDNTRFHFQDDNVQRLLDAPSIIGEYLRAGLIALLVGTAQPGATYACDAAGDGITNPAPIDGNALASLNADDDGGSFHARTASSRSGSAPNRRTAAAPASTQPVSSPSNAPRRTTRYIRYGSSILRHATCEDSYLLTEHRAPVAQLDRAADF